MLTGQANTGLGWIRVVLAVSEEYLIEALHFPGFWRNIGPMRGSRNVYEGHGGTRSGVEIQTMTLNTNAKYLDMTRNYQGDLVAWTWLTME